MPSRHLPPLDTLAFSSLSLHGEVISTYGTSKRKVDGSYANTRLGQALTPRWANERFRQVMMLVCEFRTEWPTQSLLSNDDVEFIRMAIDTALAMAEREGHMVGAAKIRSGLGPAGHRGFGQSAFFVDKIDIFF